jgi:hypothetical protein
MWKALASAGASTSIRGIASSDRPMLILPLTVFGGFSISKGLLKEGLLP